MVYGMRSQNKHEFNKRSFEQIVFTLWENIVVTVWCLFIYLSAVLACSLRGSMLKPAASTAFACFV